MCQALWTQPLPSREDEIYTDISTLLHVGRYKQSFLGDQRRSLLTMVYREGGPGQVALT